MKKRIIGTGLLLTAIVVTSVAAYMCGIDPPIGNVLGAFAAVFAAIIAFCIIKVSDRIFFSVLIFIFLASPMGSILNLYRSVDSYDKIVHYISGILLAIIGQVVFARILSKCNINISDFSNIVMPMILAACLFSSAAAGIWEIFEFAADKLAGGGMQRGMVDTVTDMIAGNLGAATYGIIECIKVRKR